MGKKLVTVVLAIFLLCTSMVSAAGDVEGTGEVFEINDSEYLNVTLESDVDIDVYMESVPEVILLGIASNISNSADLNLSGMEPSTLYYLYEGAEESNFTTDAQGTYQFSQNVSGLHILFIQEDRSTYILTDGANGGECTQIGSWDSASKTCTLTQNVDNAIIFQSNGLTLDGDGYVIGRPAQILARGLYVVNVDDITIKNVVASNFNYAAITSGTDNLLFENNVMENSRYGIRLFRYTTNAVIRENNFTTSLNGVEVYLSDDNEIYNNNFIDNTNDASIVSGTGNVFNLATPTGGNHWDTWISPDTNTDGFVDSVFTFTGGQDNYPYVAVIDWPLGDEEVPVCGNGILEYPEECDDSNTANDDGCSSICESEETASEFDDTTITDNGDGTYDYEMVDEGVTVLEVEANTGLIDLVDVVIDQVYSGSKIGISITNLTLVNATKSVSLEFKNYMCAIDMNEFKTSNQLGLWDCNADSNRIVWSASTSNKCGDAGSPVYAVDENDTILTPYTCEKFAYNGTTYAMMTGFTHTSVVALEDADDDGILDVDDKCANTAPWNATQNLKSNHYDSTNWDVADAFGCSCLQVLYCKPGENYGEYRFGCTSGTKDIWENQNGWSTDCQVDGIVYEGDAKPALTDTDGDGIIDSLDTDDDNDGILDVDDSLPEDASNGGSPDWY